MKIILILACIMSMPIHSMETHRDDLDRVGVYSPLFDAIDERDIERVLALLDSGENVNAKEGAGCEETPIIAAASIGLIDICKLLLERGADVRIREFNGENVFDQVRCGGYLWHEEGDDEDSVWQDAKTMNEVINVLITDSMFVPYCSAGEIKKSQNQIIAILCSLQSVCPGMPRDIRYKILSSDEIIMKATLHCPFGLHRGHYERIFSMPYLITKLLIRDNLLHGENAVQRLKNHKMEILRELIKPEGIEFFSDHENSDGADSFEKEVMASAPMLDNWEARYIQHIEDVIRDKLGLKK